MGMVNNPDSSGLQPVSIQPQSPPAVSKFVTEQRQKLTNLFKGALDVGTASNFGVKKLSEHHKAMLSNTRNTASNLADKADTQRRKLESQGRELTTLSEKNVKIIAKRDYLKLDIRDLKARINTFQKESFRNLFTSKRSLEGQLKKLEAVVEKLDKSISKNQEEITNKQRSITTKIDTLGSDVIHFQSAISARGKVITKADAASYKSSLRSLEYDLHISSYNFKNGKADLTSINEKQNQLSDRRKELDELQVIVSSIPVGVGTKIEKQDNVDFQRQIEKRLGSLTKEIDQLNGEIDQIFRSATKKGDKKLTIVGFELPIIARQYPSLPGLEPAKEKAQEPSKLPLDVTEKARGPVTDAGAQRLQAAKPVSLPVASPVATPKTDKASPDSPKDVIKSQLGLLGELYARLHLQNYDDLSILPKVEEQYNTALTILHSLDVEAPEKRPEFLAAVARNAPGVSPGTRKRSTPAPSPNVSAPKKTPIDEGSKRTVESEPVPKLSPKAEALKAQVANRPEQDISLQSFVRKVAPPRQEKPIVAQGKPETQEPVAQPSAASVSAAQAGPEAEKPVTEKPEGAPPKVAETQTPEPSVVKQAPPPLLSTVMGTDTHVKLEAGATTTKTEAPVLENSKLAKFQSRWDKFIPKGSAPPITKEQWKQFTKADRAEIRKEMTRALKDTDKNGLLKPDAALILEEMLKITDFADRLRTAGGEYALLRKQLSSMFEKYGQTLESLSGFAPGVSRPDEEMDVGKLYGEMSTLASCVDKPEDARKKLSKHKDTIDRAFTKQYIAQIGKFTVKGVDKVVFDPKSTDEAQVKIGKLVGEVASTEKSFADGLTSIQNALNGNKGTLRKFFGVDDAALKAIDAGKKKPTNLQSLFIDAPKIIAHSNKIQEAIKKFAKDGFKESDLAGFFQSDLWIDYSVLVANYTSRFELAYKQFGELSQSPKLDQTAKAPLNDIAKFLNVPVQRLPRWELLMKEIQKRIPDNIEKTISLPGGDKHVCTNDFADLPAQGARLTNTKIALSDLAPRKK